MTNGAQSASVHGDDSALVSCYERLRQQAMEARDGECRGLGLALLLRKGMKSWMQAGAQHVTQKPEISAAKPGIENVSAIQSGREMVVILASMAIDSRRREARQ